MTDYRAVVEHVRYWRGAVHRWSTSYSFTGSGTPPDTAACQTLLAAERKMLAGTTTGASPGDAYRVAIYLASGGTPLASYTAFDYTAPAGWTNPYAVSGIGGTVEAAAEIALLVEWPAGLSGSGKPVTFKKFFHQVLVSEQTTPGTQDVSAAHLTTYQTNAMALGLCLNSGYGLLIGNSHRLAGNPVVRKYYANHQMPRGRRRKTSTSAARDASFGRTVLKLAEDEAYGQANS